MNPSTVMFAIEAGVRLGRKFNVVRISATNESPLLLPVGNLFADIEHTDALEYTNICVFLPLDYRFHDVLLLYEFNSTSISLRFSAVRSQRTAAAFAAI